MQFDLQLSAGVIQAARFLAFGCPHTIAVSAWIAEQAAGLPLRPALPESVQQLSERFAVPVEKRGRLLIIEDAWLAAVRLRGRRIEMNCRLRHPYRGNSGKKTRPGSVRVGSVACYV